MVQTQIRLTENQMTALKELAYRQHLSIVEIIRQSIDSLLRSTTVSIDDRKRKRALAVAGRFRSGLGNLSKEHDVYLTEAFKS